MKTDKPATPKRTQASYPYFGLGFRVDLLHAPLLEIDGEWVPDIDFNKLENHFGYAVPLKPDALTGFEVRFLRRHLGWTLDDVAEKIGVTRQAVCKWEKAGDRPTRMGAATEKLFRMLVLNTLGVPSDIFQQAFDLLFQKERPARNYEIDLRWSIKKDYRKDHRALLQLMN